MFHYLPKTRALPDFPQSILILFFFLVAHATSGQIDFRPGYIVKNGNDTIRGYVAYRGDKKNYSDCAFREKAKGEVVTYSPEDIMAYGIDGEKSFRSMELPKDAPKQGKVFVRVISEGYADLYRHEKVFLLKKEGYVTTIPSPKNEPYGAPEDMVVKRTKRYVGILNYTMLDCQMNANTASYTERDISELIDAYNKCKKEFKPIQQPPGFKVNWLLFGGYLSSKLDFDYFKKIPFDGNTITGGTGIELSSPSLFDRLFFSVEGIYIKNYYQGYYEEEKLGDLFRYDVMFDVQSINVPIGIRYNLRSSRSTPYFKAGFSVSPIISSSVHTIEERENSEGEVYTRELTDNFEVKNPKGVWLGLGYNRTVGKKQMFVEFRYEHAEGYLGSNLVNYSQANNFNFFIGMRL